MSWCLSYRNGRTNPKIYVCRRGKSCTVCTFIARKSCILLLLSSTLKIRCLKSFTQVIFLRGDFKKYFILASISTPFSVRVTFFNETSTLTHGKKMTIYFPNHPQTSGSLQPVCPSPSVLPSKGRLDVWINQVGRHEGRQDEKGEKIKVEHT